MANASPRVVVKEEPQVEEVASEGTEKMDLSFSVAQPPTTSSLAAEQDARLVIKGEHLLEFVICPVLLLIKLMNG